MINKTVRHKIFGSGTICAMADDIVTVRFGSQERRFPYPDAFREHLILSEAAARQRVESVLQRLDMFRTELEEEKRQKEEQERLIRRLPLHDCAQAAFGFVQNCPKQVLEDWTLSSGRILTGFNRGKPRVPQRIYPNSACLLTRIPKGGQEGDRIIWGVFMVREDFLGPDCEDGVIPAHDRYRLLLEDEAQEQLRFWSYFPEDAEPAKWGAVEIKYCSNRTMMRILQDIAILKKEDDAASELAKAFLAYFCALNKFSVPEFCVSER